MKFFYLIAFLFLAEITVVGQKLRSDGFYVEYIKPPKSEAMITKTYAWEVKEETVDGQFKKVETTDLSSGLNAGRGNFFAGIDQLGSIPGFNPPVDGITFKDNVVIPSCLVKVKVGVAEILEAKPVSQGQLNPNVATSPSALAFNVRISVPLSFDMRYAMPPTADAPQGNDGFTQSLQNVTFMRLYSVEEKEQEFSKVYQFPKDFNALKNLAGYGSQQQLDLEFLKHKTAFLAEVKDKMIADFLKRAKLEVESLYCTSKRRLPIRLFYVKDKEDTYADLVSYATIFKEVEALLKSNIELKNNKNWFTPEIMEYVNKLVEFYTNFLNRTDLKMTHLVKSVARYNRIWLYFMQAKFDVALSEINDLETLLVDVESKLTASNSEKDKTMQLPKETKEEYVDVYDAIRFFDLASVKALIQDFEPRYRNHAARLGWN